MNECSQPTVDIKDTQLDIMMRSIDELLEQSANIVKDIEFIDSSLFGLDTPEPLRKDSDGTMGKINIMADRIIDIENKHRRAMDTLKSIIAKI